jgi:GTP:adenosylcobinamide-phosphate guanylyltransferase
MSLAGRPLRVIVLAGRRDGRPDPLAERFGTSHKCLIPLHGRPLIAHVLRTLALHDRVSSLVVSVEREAFGGIYDIMAEMRGHRCVRLLEARDNITDSVLAATEDWPGPVIVTTADHALLRPEAIDEVADALENADASIAMARRGDTLAAHPEARPRVQRFRDDAYSACNLYGLSDPRALQAAEAFRCGGPFAGNWARIVGIFGAVNLLLLRFRLGSLATGLKRISRHTGLRIVPVILEDGTQAIDVDDDRSYAIVEELMPAREEPPARRPAAAPVMRAPAPAARKVAQTGR